jgi:hypothetical protein
MTFGQYYCVGNPPTAYQHLSLDGSHTGRSWCGGPGQRNPQEIYPVRMTKFYVAVKSVLAVTVLFNEKYRKMAEAEKHY